MKILATLLILRMMSAEAVTGPSMPVKPAPKSADSYESPSTEAGDISAAGEASASGHETWSLSHKTKRITKKTMNRNCETVADKALCEKSKSKQATATQRGRSHKK